MSTYIYCIEKDGVPFYVGKTVAPKVRLSNHKGVHGNDITMLELMKCEIGEDSKFWENHYISMFLSFGFSLLNKKQRSYPKSFYKLNQIRIQLKKETNKPLNNGNNN